MNTFIKRQNYLREKWYATLKDTKHHESPTHVSPKTSLITHTESPNKLNLDSVDRIVILKEPAVS